jgi:hypothetical protein
MKSARNSMSGYFRSALCVFACVLVFSCAATDGPIRATTVSTCGRDCRILPDGHPPEHPECLESADCGERPNTERMMCIAGYVCEPACSAQWADCNKDYRDGCETPSDDGRCKGEEAFATEPLTSLSCIRESSLLGHYDCDLFRAATRAPADALDACYLGALQTQPGVEDTVDFAVTVTADGHVSKIELLASESSNAALQDCARSAIQAFLVLSDGTAQIATTYPVRAVFISHD